MIGTELSENRLLGLDCQDAGGLQSRWGQWCCCKCALAAGHASWPVCSQYVYPCLTFPSLPVCHWPVSAGGKTRQVAQLVRFDPTHKQEQQPPAAAPAPVPTQQEQAAAPAPAPAQEPSPAEGPSSVTARDSGTTDGSSSGGFPGWAIALTVVGSVTVAGAALVAVPRLYSRLQVRPTGCCHHRF